MNQFTGWTVADGDGKATQDLASQMMLHPSKRVLHLDGAVEQMSGLVQETRRTSSLPGAETRPAPGDSQPRRSDPRWSSGLVHLRASGGLGEACARRQAHGGSRGCH